MNSFFLPIVGAMYVEKCHEGGFEGLDLAKMQGDWYLTQVDEDAFRGYEPVCTKLNWRPLELVKAEDIQSQGK